MRQTRIPPLDRTNSDTHVADEGRNRPSRPTPEQLEDSGCSPRALADQICLFRVNVAGRVRGIRSFAVFVVGCLMCVYVSITDGEPAGAEIRLSDDVVVRELVEGIWLHTSYFDISGLRQVPANGLIVIDGHEAIMIDLPWTDEQTRELFDWVVREHKAAIKKVVPTHSHIDCVGGLSEAHRRGADSFALKKTVEILTKANKSVPRNWFAERMSLGCGSVRVEVAFLGGGHAVDNVVAWIAAKKVLFGGCLVKSLNARNLGNTAEADLAAYPNTLRNVLSKCPKAKIVVPGHGRPGGTELIAHTINLCEKTD